MLTVKIVQSMLHTQVNELTVMHIINNNFLDLMILSNLKATPISYNSVLLEWNVITNEVGFQEYIVNIRPPDIAGNCTNGSCNVTSTNVYIVDLKPLVNYVFTVYAVNCIGIGPESENVTFNITAYSK